MGEATHYEIYRTESGEVLVAESDFYGEAIERSPYRIELIVFRAKEIIGSLIDTVTFTK